MVKEVKRISKAQRRKIALDQLLSKMDIDAKNKKKTSKSRRRKKPFVKAGNSMMANAYANCRLRPFVAMGNSQGIPDGSAVRRLVMDHRLTTTLTFGPSGTINMVLAPAVPSPLWVQSVDVGMKINGMTFPDNNPNSALYIPVCLPEWSSLLMNWLAVAGSLNDCQTIYSAGKFRLVTMGWSLSYVGTALTNSGVIKASSATMGCGDAYPNPTTFTVYSSESGTNTNIGANQVLVTNLDAAFLTHMLTNYSSQATRVIPLKDGASGILRHSGSGYEYVCGILSTTRLKCIRIG